MLDQENPTEAQMEKQLPAVHLNPLLTDHDYCSPNKKKIERKQSSSKMANSADAKDSNPLISKNIDKNICGSPDPSQSLNTSAISLEQRDDVNKTSEYRADDAANLSDSSSASSSSLSSGTSSKNLVIVQSSSSKINQDKSPSKSHSDSTLAPPKKRRGRPSKKDMAENMKQAAATSANRIKRPRQTTSVTDKSQWITGDEQIDSVLSEHLEEDPKIERRQSAKKQLDPEFDNLSSSDYSSSDAESDQDSDNSEDDPNRLWCTCRKPHDGKFMINCDVCKDWFHGHCVGVTKLMGDRFENEGREWFCYECTDQIRSGVPRSAIPVKIVKKEKKKKVKKTLPGKRGPGRPRKSESNAKESVTRVSQRNLKRSSIPIDSKHGINSNRLRRNLSRPEVKTETFDEFEDSQRLKVLIKERKKEFFYKRHLAEQQKAERRNQLGLGGRHSLTANLSDSLDSLASSTNTPNMNNLPINIKSEHKERKKPNIVLQINTKKDARSDQGNSRLVTTIVRKKTISHSQDNDPVVSDLFTAEPIQINKRVKVEINQTNNSSSESNSDNRTRRNSDNQAKGEHSNGNTDTPKKKRKDSLSPNGSGAAGSEHIRQKIKESLDLRRRQMTDLVISDDKTESLAVEIEVQLNECFKEGSSKYLTKFRSLIFNLRDSKNEGLVKNVLIGEISPSKLVRMSHDEMASHELAKWRERENKHSIELIKRDAELAAQQVIVKKTHKGEEVISGPLTEQEEAKTEEPPTSPTKQPIKDTTRPDLVMTLTTPLSISGDYSCLDLKTEDPPEDVSDEQQEVDEFCWLGSITMPEVSKFNASAKSIAGSNVGFMRSQISRDLMVCGRIAPDQVQGYIKKLRTTTKNQILLVQLYPQTPDDKKDYDTFFDYLYSRNRYGVIQTNPQVLKDFYVLPLHENGSIPDVLKPLTGSMIDRKDPNCLLGLLVKSKRVHTSSTSSVN